jgi:predicted house-cleaning noncanonical NTP pyrophosphatase (MazG superfamily)
MSQETEAVAIPKKKQVRKEIVEKLTGALADYKQDLGEKKLATHVKNVSKLISRDLLKISKKKRTKKTAAKKTRQKTAKAKAKK